MRVALLSCAMAVVSVSSVGECQAFHHCRRNCCGQGSGSWYYFTSAAPAATAPAPVMAQSGSYRSYSYAPGTADAPQPAGVAPTPVYYYPAAQPVQSPNASMNPKMRAWFR